MECVLTWDQTFRAILLAGAVAGSFTAILALTGLLARWIFLPAIREALRHIVEGEVGDQLKELQPNGGSTMRDKLDSVVVTVERMDARQDRMQERQIAVHAALTAAGISIPPTIA